MSRNGRRQPGRELSTLPPNSRSIGHPGVLPAPVPGVCPRPPASGSSLMGPGKIIRVYSRLLQHRRSRSSTRRYPQATIRYIAYLIRLGVTPSGPLPIERSPTAPAPSPPHEGYNADRAHEQHRDGTPWRPQVPGGHLNRYVHLLYCSLY